MGNFQWIYYLVCRSQSLTWFILNLSILSKLHYFIYPLYCVSFYQGYFFLKNSLLFSFWGKLLFFFQLFEVTCDDHVKWLTRCLRQIMWAGLTVFDYSVYFLCTIWYRSAMFLCLHQGFKLREVFLVIDLRWVVSSNCSWFIVMQTDIGRVLHGLCSPCKALQFGWSTCCKIYGGTI